MEEAQFNLYVIMFAIILNFVFIMVIKDRVDREMQIIWGRIKEIEKQNYEHKHQEHMG